MMDRCRPDEAEQADVNKNESKNSEALTTCNLYTLLALRPFDDAHHVGDDAVQFEIFRRVSAFMAKADIARVCCHVR